MKPLADPILNDCLAPAGAKPHPLAGRRVAVVLYSHYPADPRPRRAAQAMVQGGLSVDLICLRESSDEPRRETINGVNVLRLSINKRRGGSVSYLLQYSAFLFACFVILASRSVTKRYDVVHAHNMPDFLVFSALVPKLRGAKVILDLHDPMPELMRGIYGLRATHWMVRLLIRLESWSIAFADQVQTPNMAFSELFISRGCPREKMKVVMNSPQEDIFNPVKAGAQLQTCRRRNACFKLMYHGLLVERHGLDIAIQAVAALRERIPKVEFHIYGGHTPFMNEMKGLVENLGLNAHVFYHGGKSHREIAQALAATDLGIVPNRRNPFTELNMPTRIFENLAMNRPVIVPDTQGIRDYFDDSELVFFQPESVSSIAEAISWVYEHPQEMAMMILKSQRVLQAHAWGREKLKFISHLEELLVEAKVVIAG